MSVDLVAFVDESKRPVRDRRTGRVAGTGDFYVVASVVTLEGELGDYREAITKLEGELGYELHYGELRSQSRRVEAVEAVAALEGWEAHLFESVNPIPAAGGWAEHRIRAKALEAAFVHLAKDCGVDRVVLETRAHPTAGFAELDAKDHRVLQRLITRAQVPAGFSISHASKDEPILSIADVLASSRTDLLCGRDSECYARLGHRVDGIHQVL